MVEVVHECAIGLSIVKEVGRKGAVQVVDDIPSIAIHADGQSVDGCKADLLEEDLGADIGEIVIVIAFGTGGDTDGAGWEAVKPDISEVALSCSRSNDSSHATIGRRVAIGGSLRLPYEDGVTHRHHFSCKVGSLQFNSRDLMVGHCEVVEH